MDSTTCWTIIGVLATTVSGMAAYIVKIWRDHSAEVKALNDEYKLMLRKILEEMHDEPHQPPTA